MRYYFDINDCGDATFDEEGMERTSDDAALKEATRSAANIAADVLPARMGGEVRVHVRHHNGKPVGTAISTLRVEQS